MNDCPNCEYHKERAQRWREEAYRQAGHPLPEPEWQGLTEEDLDEIERWVKFKEEGSGSIPKFKLIKYVETKLKEKNA